MSKFLFAAVGLGGLAAAAPAVAASGYVGAGYERIEAEAGGLDADGDGFSVEGAAAFDAGGTLGFDVDGAYVDIEDSDNIGATGHLYAKGDGYRFGGFAGVADAEDTTVLSIGAEGLVHFERVTLGAAAGYADADEADGIGLDGEARLFLTDRVRLDAGLGWASVDSGAGDDDAFSFGVGGELMAPTLPVSLFANYSRSEFDESDLEVDRVRVGLRYSFGGDLLSRDRDGPSFAGLSSLGAAIGTN